MIHPTARLLALVAIVAAPTASWRVLRAPAPVVGVERRGEERGEVTPPDHADARAFATLAASDDPFRRERRPPRVRFGEPAVVVAPPAPMPPKPQLVLTGLLTGAAPSVVIEGVPGREGPAVARPGDTLGGLRIMAIGAESVTITGFDTTWQLRLRIPWR